MRNKNLTTLLVILLITAFASGWLSSYIFYYPKDVTVYIKPFSCYLDDNDIIVERDNLEGMIKFCNKRNYRIVEVITLPIPYRKYDPLTNPKPQIIE